MDWRRVMRVVSVGVVVVCAGVWVGSYWMSAGVVQDGWWPLVFMWDAALVCHNGEILLAFPAGSFKSEDWRFWCAPNEAPTAVAFTMQNYYAQAGYRFMGFSLKTGNPFACMIPMWFLTLVAGFGAWFAWRKTRPEKVGRAFPVEVGKDKG